ncbi:MAG: hypothetical protein ABW022_02965 [Actinoplanes sp.]
MRARVRLTQDTEEGTAAGIYGLIVSAGVLAAAHAKTTPRLAAAVVITLAVYWAAERYARVVAERIHLGHPPSWPELRRQLATGWELVTVSTLPLLTMLVFALLGARQPMAVLAGLICCTVLLCVAGWRMGDAGRLSTKERLVSTVVAGTFGGAMIVLKVLLH